MLNPKSLNWNKDGGLKTLLEQYNHRSKTIPVFDRGILMDMDTPEDYQRVCRQYRRLKMPGPAECRDFLNMMHPDDTAPFATAIYNAMVENKCALNKDLVTAAGRLYDIGKGSPDHAAGGGRIIEVFGFSSMAETIACHMDLDVKDNAAAKKAAEKRMNISVKIQKAIEKQIRQPVHGIWNKIS